MAAPASGHRNAGTGRLVSEPQTSRLFTATTTTTTTTTTTLTDRRADMFTYQTYPDLAKATIEERLRRAPHTGIRRSARLISLEIRRSRHAEHRQQER
jgi:hypothetical protein